MPDREFVDDHCASCLLPLPEDVDGLYCTEFCEQVASTLRWWRRKIALDEVDRADIALTLRTRIAHIVAGGYHKRARTLPPETRHLVWQRDNGLCRQCGAPGTEIDHIDGDSCEPANLQLLCRPCHHAKTEERIIPASDEDQDLVKVLFLRAYAPVPLLLCDDEVAWPIQRHALRKERRQRLLDLLIRVDVDVSGFKPRTPRLVLVEALGNAVAGRDGGRDSVARG